MNRGDNLFSLKAEIARLQEAQKAAHRERQRMLQQSQEILELRKTTQQVRLIQHTIYSTVTNPVASKLCSHLQTN